MWSDTAGVQWCRQAGITAVMCRICGGTAPAPATGSSKIGDLPLVHDGHDVHPGRRGAGTMWARTQTWKGHIQFFVNSKYKVAIGIK